MFIRVRSNNVISPKKECQKTYRVWLKNALSADKAADVIEQFKQGVQLQGESSLTRPAILELVYNSDLPSRGANQKFNKELDTEPDGAVDEVLLTITEGKYHQVKRMFAAVGNKVVGLHREQIGDIKLADLPAGQWRALTSAEVALFS